MGQPHPLFVYFCHFLHTMTNIVLNLTKLKCNWCAWDSNRVHRMEGIDESAPGRFFNGHIFDGHIIDGHIIDGHIFDQ